MDVQIRQISSSAMLTEAADRMRTLGTPVLAVVEDHQIVGVVLEGHLAPDALAGDMDPRLTPVRSVMTFEVACCSQQDGIERAVEIVEAGHAQWLILLDCHGAAVGVLSVEDLASRAAERSPLRP